MVHAIIMRNMRSHIHIIWANALINSHHGLHIWNMTYIVIVCISYVLLNVCITTSFICMYFIFMLWDKIVLCYIYYSMYVSVYIIHVSVYVSIYEWCYIVIHHCNMSCVYLHTCYIHTYMYMYNCTTTWFNYTLILCRIWIYIYTFVLMFIHICNVMLLSWYVLLYHNIII